MLQHSLAIQLIQTTFYLLVTVFLIFLLKEEMQKKFREQQDLIANPPTGSDSREPEKHTFASFQGGTASININNNNQSS